MGDFINDYRRLQPDLVVIDDWFVINRSDGDRGINSLYTGSEKPILCQFIIMARDIKLLPVKELTGKGVRGVYSKSSDLRNLIVAIKTVLEGRPFFSPEFGIKPTEHNYLSIAKNPLLSETQIIEKERNFLEIMCEGKSKKQAAELLKVSTRTIERLTVDLQTKTRTQTFAELIAFVMKNNLLKTQKSE